MAIGRRQNPLKVRPVRSTTGKPYGIAAQRGRGGIVDVPLALGRGHLGVKVIDPAHDNAAGSPRLGPRARQRPRTQGPTERADSTLVLWWRRICIPNASSNFYVPP